MSKRTPHSDDAPYTPTPARWRLLPWIIAGISIFALSLGTPGHAQALSKLKPQNAVASGQTKDGQAKTKRKYTLYIDKETRKRLRIHFLDSATLKRRFRYMVYLPKLGVDPNKRYPLLVLLHGLGELPHGWITLGKVHKIVDHLVDEGLMPAPIILMASGGNGYWSNWSDGLHPYGDLVVREYLNDMRRLYPIADSPKLTGIVGCSMGGFGALSLGLRYPELFGFVVALSATDMEIAVRQSPKRKIYRNLVGTPPNELAVEHINPRNLVQRGYGSPSQKFLMIYGSREGPKFGEGTERVAQAMRLRGLDVRVFRVPNAGHGWRSAWARAHPWWIHALADYWNQSLATR